MKNSSIVTLLVFLVFTSVSHAASTKQQGQNCVGNYTNFSFIATFDDSDIEYFHVSSSDINQEVAELIATRLHAQNQYETFDQRIPLPFSIHPADWEYINLKIDLQTGEITPDVQINPNGYSVWIPRCVEEEDKKNEAPRKVVPEKLPKYLKRVIYRH